MKTLNDLSIKTKLLTAFSILFVITIALGAVAIRSAVSNVLTASEDLSRQAANLRQEVDRFLERIRAA